MNESNSINNSYNGRIREFKRVWDSAILMPKSLKEGYYPTVKEWCEFFKENP